MKLPAPVLERDDVARLVENEVMASTPPPQPVAIHAGAGGGSSRPSLPHVGEYVVEAVKAQRGDVTAQARIENVRRQLTVEAAVSEEAAVADQIGIVPDFYSREILDGLRAHIPLLNSATRRSDLPATGMNIIKPDWTAVPKGDFYVEGTGVEPASTPVKVGSRTVPVLSWSVAIIASINLMERSTPGYAQSFYEQAGIDYMSAKEARIAADMLAAVVAGPSLTDTSGASTVKAKIAALVTACIGQQTDDRDVFRGLVPTFAAVATDVWETLSGTDTDAGVAFGSARVNIGSLSGALGSLDVVLVPTLDAGGIVVGSSSATQVQDGRELQLRSVLVSTSSVELGTFANCSIDVEYPAALAANNAAFS